MAQESHDTKHFKIFDLEEDLEPFPVWDPIES